MRAMPSSTWPVCRLQVRRASATTSGSGSTTCSSRRRTLPFEVYAAKFAEGGIVEERIEGAEVRSPSVQLRTLPGGRVEVLSTHDQMLGGASGQSYLGCVFPAAAEYARSITEHAEAIGHRLASTGALGRFAVDFVVVRDGPGPGSPTRSK